MKQKLANLRNQLERWRSHNEVHAKPADKMLYEFLSELLKLGEQHEEQPEPSKEIQAESSLAEATSSDEEGDGGNNPDNPPTLP